MNLCIHCEHFLPKADASDRKAAAELGVCTRSVLVVNPVTGSESYRFAENERSLIGECGPEGRHFQVLQPCD